jgi:mono/diheme cytochrome c family protein/uncharacterized membrane protein
MQSDSSGSQQRSASRASAQGAAKIPAARALFRQHCAKCHGADGTGSRSRRRLSEIPDFTTAAWQARRSDAQLLASILDGKGQAMPSWRGKVNEEQARGLVAQVRAFAPTTDKSGPEKQKGATSPSGFEEEFRRLQEEMGELQKHSHELSEGSAGGERSKPSEPSQRSPPDKPSESAPRLAPAKPSGPAAAGAPTARELFRKHCVKCHGADGTGSRSRRLPEIPDFTAAAWQARRSDAQLLASILDGKGKAMPPWRGKISKEQARGLGAYVRAFAPATGRSGREEQQVPDPAKPAEAEPPGGFFEGLIQWLGKCHPATVHFPIALLTAAAVAELLRLTTGKPAFAAVVRYCLWFGALTAVAAGVLGWFMGGFRLTDASWVVMTHRWLGTSTVACAGLALVLSEAGRRADGNRSRRWARVALLVAAALTLVTGFFGGAVVFGLDHYSWPQ